MTRHYSTASMIERLSWLLGTSDLTEWEQGFVESLQRRMQTGEVTKLTDKQVETLDQLHSNHFA